MNPKTYFLLQVVLYFHVLGIFGDDEIPVHLNKDLSSYTLLSPGYPKNPTADEVTVWNVDGIEDQRLELTCSDLALLSRVGCTKGGVIINNGRGIFEVCGTTASYRKQSVKNTMTVRLTTVGNLLGRLNCTVKLLSSSGEKRGETDLPQTSCSCGRMDENKILDEENPKLEEITFVAYLRKIGTKATFCDASILTKRHVLTAASCVAKIKPQDLEVVLGSHKSTTDTKDNRVQIVKAQMTYSHENPSDDIGLVELSQDIKFNERVGPICLPTEDYNKQPQTELGWCVENEKEERRAIVLLECDKAKMEKRESKLDPQAVCKNPVHLAVGSPIVYWEQKMRRYVLGAVLSRGKDKNTAVNIFKYFDWIQTKISQHSPPCSTCEKLEKMDYSFTTKQ